MYRRAGFVASRHQPVRKAQAVLSRTLAQSFIFSMVDISEKPFPDCTVPDNRSETFPSLLNNDVH
jgi:hypothetical protein